METTHPGERPVGVDGSGPAASHRPWTRLRPAAGPVLVAALTAFTLVTLPVIGDASAAYRAVGPAAYALVALAAVATVARSRWPVASVLLVGAAVGTYLVLSYPYGPMFGFLVLCVYAVARRRPLRHAAAATAAAWIMLLAHVPINDAAVTGAVGVLWALAWVAIPFTIGAARQLVVEAQRRERAAADRQLVDAERLRLSQDVHDVVGHGLAAIQMQADITMHVDKARPERMLSALKTISQASQEALEELRATLDSIRADAIGDAAAAPRAPTPGLARVEELRRRVEDAGVQVDLTVSGRARPLPPAADVAAFRVLQEALTNVVKHSAHEHADVRIRHEAHVVILEVTNQDLGPAPTEGIGIGGMRRRVTQLGGTFDAGPGPRTGTFQVRALILRTRGEPAQ